MDPGFITGTHFQTKGSMGITWLHTGELLKHIEDLCPLLTDTEDFYPLVTDMKDLYFLLTNMQDFCPLLTNMENLCPPSRTDMEVSVFCCLEDLCPQWLTCFSFLLQMTSLLLSLPEHLSTFWYYFFFLFWSTQSVLRAYSWPRDHCR